MISRTLLVIAVAASATLALMAIGTWAGLACCAAADAARPSARLIASLAVNLAAIMFCWAGVTLAATAMVRRRAVAGAVGGVAAFGAYLLDYLGRAWEPARAVSRLSPFHYFEPMALIMGQPLSGRNVAVLVGISVAAIAVSYVGFARRDI